MKDELFLWVSIRFVDLSFPDARGSTWRREPHLKGTNSGLFSFVKSFPLVFQTPMSFTFKGCRAPGLYPSRVRRDKGDPEDYGDGEQTFLLWSPLDLVRRVE